MGSVSRGLKLNEGSGGSRLVKPIEESGIGGVIRWSVVLMVEGFGGCDEKEELWPFVGPKGGYFDLFTVGDVGSREHVEERISRVGTWLMVLRRSG